MSIFNCFFLWSMHLGTQIKIARISKGLTQQDLADKVHKTRPLISSIEQTGNVNELTLRKICQVLEIHESDLKKITEKNANSLVLADQSQEELQRQIINLQLDVARLTDLVETQKDLIDLLKQKIAKK